MFSSSICETLGIEKCGKSSESICEKNINDFYNAFFNAMEDYTLDSRGDVGAW